MKTFEVCFEPDRNLKMKKRQLISLCHLLKTTESREGRTCATLLTRGIFSAAFSSACALVCRDAGRDEGEELRDKESGREIYEVNIRILSEELSVCAGELETLLLRWDEGRLPASCRLPERGQGRDCRGPVPAQPTGKNKHSQGGHYMTHSFQQHTDRHTSVHAFSSLFFFLRHRPPTPSSASFPCFFPRLLSDRLLPAMPYESTDHTPPSPLHLPSMADERCARHNERTAPWVTLITDVTILDGALCPCAAAAILAMVLRWFIWLIAMVTDAGGRLTGIRGWGIIINGSSKPEDERGE